MVTAKVRTLLFEAWWRESVVAEAGAVTKFNDLYRHYLNAGGGNGMGRSAFVARLNGLGVRERKRQGVRYRLGVKLRDAPEEAAPEPVRTRARPVRVKAAARASADSRVVEALVGAAGTSARATYSTTLDVGDARQQPPPSASRPPPPAAPVEDTAPLMRVTPYNPGESEPATMLMLDISLPEDEASAYVVRELFVERKRQRRPEEEGGEGRSAKDDDRYAGDLALAASAYAFAAGQPEDYRAFLEMNGKPVRTANFGWHVLEIARRLWPWDAAWWKPRTPREDLVRAGALVIAAIEKHDRKEARGRLSAEEQLKATGV